MIMAADKLISIEDDRAERFDTALSEAMNANASLALTSELAHLTHELVAAIAYGPGSCEKGGAQ